ncbi:MAG: 23S rRNA (adenine(2503)-C(2))-methyltransferase RlmN [Bacteroidota bacterium]
MPTVTAPPDLLALDQAEMEALMREIGEPAYRGRQLFEWVHEKGARSFDAMTNLPKALREHLAAEAQIGTLTETRRQTATDGTIKTLLQLPSGRAVEAVLIPDFKDDGSPRRMTACVSSQVGCAMSCTFCATGLLGFQENLTAGQIAAQAQHLDALATETYGRGLTNIVYMGMGEPLQNYPAVAKSVGLITEGLGLSPKRVTVSTVGLARRIRQLADDQAAERIPGFRLAVSLHAPTDAQRSAIMPVNRSEKTGLTALRNAIQHYVAITGYPVTYEYCVFAGVNDSNEDAKHLGRVSRWAASKVNLIVYNPVEGTGFTSPPEHELERFIRALVREGVRVTVRRSRGQDIDAACGQLAGAET